MQSENVKRCPGCGVDKPHSEFYKSGHSTGDGLQSRCKKCKVIQNSDWKRRNPEKVKLAAARYRKGYHKQLAERRRAYVESHQVEVAEYRRRNKLAIRYGITLEQYTEIYNRQGGACAICRRTGRLVVDHDHKTKEVRGLLCHRCNVSIGSLGDTVAGLMRAVEYLEKSYSTNRLTA